MGIKYSEVESAGLLDEDVLEYVPKTCSGDYGCGSELEFSDNLTQIGCPNRYCTHKIASRLEAMAKEMKADGWGESTCLTVVKAANLISPAQVFLLEGKDLSSVTSGSYNKLESICDRNKRKVQLWQVVKLLNIPGLSMNAMKIFDGYTNMTEAFNDIEGKGVPFIMERLGISKSNDSSVMACSIYYTLLEYKDEILFAEKQFDIFQPTGDILKIAITGGVNGFTNKGEFIKHINNLGCGKYTASLMNTVNAQLDILIADNDTSSNKYKSACRVNDKAGYEKIKIFNADECIEYLKETYKIM